MRSTLLLFALVACSSDPPTPIAPPAATTDPTTPSPDAPVAPPTPTPSPTCGTRSDRRGKTSRTLTVDGKKRTYEVYLPASLASTKAAPLVFVHHGFTMSGREMRDITGYPALADQEGIALVFPDGQGGPDSTDAPWNVGANACPSLWGDVPVATGDDFAFQDAIKADLLSDQCVDDAHVFVTGFSMGGYFAHHTGCMRSDIRAVAPHSGGTHDLAACPVAKKPIIIFHGDADDVIAAGCDVPYAKDTPAGFTPSASAWAAHNGCAQTTHTTSVEKGTCTYYDGCPKDAQVAICVMKGMGHCWAGGVPDAVGDSCPGWASATQLEWDFFETYAW